MEKLIFETTINAPRQTVWENLWSEHKYPEWTSAFCEGSHMVTDLKEGSKVLFLDGNGSGMVSKVAVNKPNEYISFEHLGEVKNGVEDTTSEQVKMWTGAHENYTLTGNGNKTHLFIELESVGMPTEFKDYFVKTWPVALNKLKAMAEQAG